MFKRRLIAALYALALTLAIPAQLRAECYYGKVFVHPDGLPYCEPFLGGECMYCEVVDKG